MITITAVVSIAMGMLWAALTSLTLPGLNKWLKKVTKVNFLQVKVFPAAPERFIEQSDEKNIGHMDCFVTFIMHTEAYR